jgi:hypothetical protein
MPTQTINLNNTGPAAPSGSVNVAWQSDAPSLDPTVVRNVSANVSILVGDTGAGGAAGLAPAPAAGDAAEGKVLKADGTWYVPPATPLPSGPANEILATPNGAAGAAALRALVAADLPVATTSALGAVKPDGSTITIAAGVISAAAASLPTGSGNKVIATPADGSSAASALRALAAADLPVATTSALGAVKPDGSSITIAAGVISAVGGGGGGGSSSLFGIGNPLGANTPAFIQGTSLGGSGSTASAVVAGHLLIVAISSWSPGGIPTISDNLGTVYYAVSTRTGEGIGLSLFAGIAGASGICTVTIGNTNHANSEIAEFSFGTITLDGAVQTVDSSTSPSSTLNLTTSIENDILISVYGDGSGGGSGNPSTGWTKVGFTTSGGWVDSGLAYQIGSAAGAKSSFWTANGGNLTMLMAFKATATPVSGSQGQLYFDTTNPGSYVEYVYNSSGWHQVA